MKQKNSRGPGTVSSGTAEKYGRIAESFYRDYLGGEVPTPEKMCNALLRRADNDMAHGSWQALKSAITWHQRQCGHTDIVEAIQATEWPEGQPRKTERCGRAKKVSLKDQEKIVSEIKRRRDAGWAKSGALEATFILASEIGCRPHEMPGVSIQYDDVVYVPASKTWDQGDRGASRLLRVSDESLQRIRHAIRILQQEPGYNSAPKRMMDRITRRWTSMVEQLFPRRSRKNRPTMYAFRHQLASDLKHDINLDKRCRLEAAYIMGHQATRSLEDYGDPRSSRDRSHIKPAIGVYNTMVRTTHLTPAENAVANYDPLAQPAYLFEVEGEDVDLLALSDTPKEPSSG